MPTLETAIRLFQEWPRKSGWKEEERTTKADVEENDG
jgi:hypothetical protein